MISVFRLNRMDVEAAVDVPDIAEEAFYLDERDDSINQTAKDNIARNKCRRLLYLCFKSHGNGIDGGLRRTVVWIEESAFQRYKSPSNEYLYAINNVAGLIKVRSSSNGNVCYGI